MYIQDVPRLFDGQPDRAEGQREHDAQDEGNRQDQQYGPGGQPVILVGPR